MAYCQDPPFPIITDLRLPLGPLFTWGKARHTLSKIPFFGLSMITTPLAPPTAPRGPAYPPTQAPPTAPGVPTQAGFCPRPAPLQPRFLEVKYIIVDVIRFTASVYVLLCQRTLNV